MAYPAWIKNQAFVQFANGLSYDEVAAQMQAEHPDVCPNLTRQAVARWAKQEDWLTRRGVMEQKIARMTENKVISRRMEMLEGIKELRQSALEQARCTAAKSFGEAVNALNKLTDMELELSGERARMNGAVNIEKMMVVVLETMGEDPELGKLFQKRQEFLLKKISEKLHTE